MKMILLLGLILSSIQIGDYRYKVIYSNMSLGETYFVADDSKGTRTMVLPSDSDQLAVSEMHEIMHACMHNHEHSFANEAELKKHLFEQQYTEEEMVTILAPCILDYEDKEKNNE